MTELAPTSPFFSRLSPEIRQMIYTEYIREHTWTYHLSNDCPSLQKRSYGIINLLCVSSQVWKATEPLIHKRIVAAIPNENCDRCKTAACISSVPIGFRHIGFQQPLKLDSPALAAFQTAYSGQGRTLDSIIGHAERNGKYLALPNLL